MKALLVVEVKGVAEEEEKAGGPSVASFLQAVAGTSNLRIRVGVVFGKNLGSRLGVAFAVGFLDSSFGAGLCCLEWLARLNSEGVCSVLAIFWL